MSNEKESISKCEVVIRNYDSFVKAHDASDRRNAQWMTFKGLRWRICYFVYQDGPSDRLYVGLEFSDDITYGRWSADVEWRVQVDGTSDDLMLANGKSRFTNEENGNELGWRYDHDIRACGGVKHDKLTLICELKFKNIVIKGSFKEVVKKVEELSRAFQKQNEEVEKMLNQNRDLQAKLEKQMEEYGKIFNERFIRAHESNTDSIESAQNMRYASADDEDQKRKLEKVCKRCDYLEKQVKETFLILDELMKVRSGLQDDELEKLRKDLSMMRWKYNELQKENENMRKVSVEFSESVAKILAEAQTQNAMPLFQQDSQEDDV